jgi:hypothetical protein
LLPLISVISATGISLSSIGDPQLTMEGQLLSLEGRYAEAVLDGETALRRGVLVQFQTAETLYLGEIVKGWNEAGTNRIRVLIEHSVDLERAAAVRRLWDTESSG